MQNPTLEAVLSRFLRKLLYFKEWLKGGGDLRERILLELLATHYSSRFKRQWELGEVSPHFEDHRIFIFNFAFTERFLGPFFLYRGFISSEVLRKGNTLLDIGCGDGFFTCRFFSTRCSHIDAIDIDMDAIKMCNKINNAPNISYYQLDALKEPFPQKKYDVIVLDGSLGHFSESDAEHLLEKISAAMNESSIFVGSESIGKDADDHLQVFESSSDFYKLFSPLFKYVECRQFKYRVGIKGSHLRNEAYWRCSNNKITLETNHWEKLIS